MKQFICFGAALAMTIGVIGCDDKNSTADDAKKAQENAAEAQKDANEVKKDAAENMDEATQKANEAAGAATSAQQKADAEAAKAGELTADATKEAEGKLAQAMQYIKENKFDMADDIIDGLEKNKEALPKAIQDQIVNARTALNAAKGASDTGLKLPG